MTVKITSPQRHSKLTWCIEKFKIQQYILTRGFETACFIAGGWYFENFYWSKLSGGFPFEPETNATGEEVYTIRYPSWGPPSAKLAFVAIQDDFGDFVHGMLLDPQKWNGKVVLAASGLLSWPELIDGFEKCEHGVRILWREWY